MKEYSKKKLKMYYKTILPAEHHQQLIIDCGADTSGIGGPEWIIDEMTDRYVDISGYNNTIHDKKSRIGSAITAIDLPDNKTILIKINEATILSDDANSLLSTTQASYYGTIINCVPKSRGGTIPYIFKDDIYIPLNIKDGLIYTNIRKPTNEELKECETIILTSEEPWNPEHIHEDYTIEDYEFS